MADLWHILDPTLHTSDVLNNYGGNMADRTLWYENQGVGQDAAAKEQARIEDLRNRGIAAGRGLAEGSRQSAADLEARRVAAEQAGQAGLKDIAAQQANALAAGTAQGAGGGSAYGALAQAGKQAGLTGAEYGKGLAEQQFQMTNAVGEANKEAGAQEMEAIKLEGEAGSHTSDVAKKVADYRKQAEAALATTKSFFWDDNKLGAQKIRALIQNETDPEVVKQMNAFADSVESGAYDY